MSNIKICTLDNRIAEILKNAGMDSLANMSDAQIEQSLAKLREQREQKKLPTISESGMTLAKCGKVKARKRPHKHTCQACKTEHECAIGEGCIWAKDVPACCGCAPNLSEPFAVTSKPKETEDHVEK